MIIQKNFLTNRKIRNKINAPDIELWKRRYKNGQPQIMNSRGEWGWKNYSKLN